MATERTYGAAPPGHRLPEATRLGLITLQIADLDRSITFYRDVIGCKVITTTAAGATLGSHGDTPLIELRAKPGVREVPRSGLLGLYHFALLLPTRADLGTFVGHLEKTGTAFSASDHFVSESLYLWDPDGLGIEVYADRSRDVWRSNGGQLVMGTERLDLASVVRSAAGREWAGLPAGTSMGHVHLSVGHLPTAREFYHEALGFEATVWSYPGALFLSAGGYHHHVAANTWASRARPAGDEDARLLEWQLILPEPRDVNRAAGSLREAGYDVETTSTGRVVIDPWGTALRMRT
jgi:catechol 2,3-dioxygenase